MDLDTVLGSGVVAGLIAGLVTLRTTERKIAIENITQQRQIWREKIRELAQRINSSYQNDEAATLRNSYVEMQLLLNPNDLDDQSILNTIWDMASSKKPEHLDIVLGEKLALLLKHDWERAKQEAKPIWFRGSKVKRESYEQFKYKRAAANK